MPHFFESLPGHRITGSDAPEKTALTLGFLPLSDCAPLLVAWKLGLGRRHGIGIELRRQPSWAAVRDRLLSGELDAAQALYGMTYGIELGLGGPQAAMAILMTLNRNGQAITVSRRLAASVHTGRSLRHLLAGGPRRPVFAHTFPTGTHAMWLYYWLAAQGVDPLHDIDSIVIPPPQMGEALAGGLLDGFCAGDPWHAAAEEAGIGRTLVRSSEIWPGHPEKVLACRRDFVSRYPNTTRALVCTLLDACRWLDDPAHRVEAAGWLATAIGCGSAQILPRLLGDSAAPPPRFFSDGDVNFPYLSDGLWFLDQFCRWGLLDPRTDLPAVVSAVNQTGLYREAAQALDIDVPGSPYRSSTLCDGVVWNGKTGAHRKTPVG